MNTALTRLTTLIGLATVFAFTACEKVPSTPPDKKPVGIQIEVQVFSLPRALAVSTVLGQPPETDPADLIKRVQTLVTDGKARLVATPTLATISGNRAVLESITEHRYPIEFEQPQIPQTFGNTATKITKSTTITEETITFPQTPATPSTFETRNMGTTLEVEPVASADLSQITMAICTQNVALSSTIKYKGELNVEVEQPIFYTKKVNSTVAMKNGGTLLLGTIEPDPTLSKTEDLTEVIFLRATVR